MFVLGFFLLGCTSQQSAVDQRMKKLEKKKKRNPSDCPKVDC